MTVAVDAVVYYRISNATVAVSNVEVRFFELGGFFSGCLFV